MTDGQARDGVQRLHFAIAVLSGATGLERSLDDVRTSLRETSGDRVRRLDARAAATAAAT